jgi:transposase
MPPSSAQRASVSSAVGLLVQLTARVGWQKAAVALANKNARILWAVMTRGEAFNPRHVSVKPGASTSTSTLTPAAA